MRLLLVFVRVFFWGQNLVIQKTTSGHLKKIRQFAPAPTPFVSSVGNPPTDQDSNCVPFRFLAFLLLETVYLFRSVRTLVPIFRCLIFSLSCSKLFKAVVESCGFGEFGFGFIRRIARFLFLGLEFSMKFLPFPLSFFLSVLDVINFVFYFSHVFFWIEVFLFF